MNLTEQYRAKTFAFIAPPSEGPVAGWKGYALRVTVLAVGFGIYVLLFRRKTPFSGRWNWRRSRDAPGGEPNSDSSGEAKELSNDDNDDDDDDDDEPIVAYNDEVCPICLGAPKIGVKAPCGHLLCADCLANYCDVRIAPAPPPCPLCRAPLNSVALACDFAILSPKPSDPNTVLVQDWIREYNSHRGLMTQERTVLTTRFILYFNILTLFLLVGLIASRLQVLAEI